MKERPAGESFPKDGGLSEAEAKKQERIAALRAWVESSVRQVLGAGDEAEDIRPEMDLVAYEAAKNGLLPERIGEARALADLDTKMFFWNLVGDALKKDTFDLIDNDITPLIEKYDYAGAELLMSEKLREAVQKLSPSVSKDPDELQFALIGLRKAFYETFPETKALIFGAREAKRPTTKTRGSQWSKRGREKRTEGRGKEAPIPGQPAEQKPNRASESSG